MDSIWEVMNWVVALRIQRPNKTARKSMKRGPAKGRNHDAQLQILFQLSQELASSSLLFMICSPTCWAMSLTIPSSILHLRRGRVLPFQLSVGLALSYSVKPPQLGNLVGPVRPLKIWLHSQCRLWSPWIMYRRGGWWSNSFYSHTYLSHNSQTS